MSEGYGIPIHRGDMFSMKVYAKNKGHTIFWLIKCAPYNKQNKEQRIRHEVACRYSDYFKKGQKVQFHVPY